MMDSDGGNEDNQVLDNDGGDEEHTVMDRAGVDHKLGLDRTSTYDEDRGVLAGRDQQQRRFVGGLNPFL